ncbi:MAG: hypothetical protein CMO66_01125 [Verrucomicrobiales bacterium]|nr:hypothetical protein [Verrucomicrobiales bacterium]|tara:strand:- start:2658 stop:3242 length:585 start_codon:yes stop_codon:yes gene_type:complete
MNDWNIQTRGHVCEECESPFTDRDACHTLLVDENREFRRLDLCDDCWATKYAEGANHRKGFISHWQGIYEAPPEEPPDVIEKDTAESLLRKLVATHEERWREASYILAVMLERKRLLKVKEQLREKGRRVFVYEHPASGDLFTIPDPDLKLEELEQVQIEVAALLEHGLPRGDEPWPPEPVEEEQATPEPTTAS